MMTLSYSVSLLANREFPRRKVEVSREESPTFPPGKLEYPIFLSYLRILKIVAVNNVNKSQKHLTDRPLFQSIL